MREGCVKAPSATQTQTHTHTHIAHIVLFFDNRCSYIMNPIHIKAGPGIDWRCSKSPKTGQNHMGEQPLPNFFPPSPLLFVTPQKISSVRGWTCVADISVLNKYRNGHLICCGLLSVLIWPRKQTKRGISVMVLKCIPHGAIGL